MDGHKFTIVDEQTPTTSPPPPHQAPHMAQVHNQGISPTRPNCYILIFNSGEKNRPNCKSQEGE